MVVILAIGGMGTALANGTGSDSTADDVKDVVAAINKNARKAARLIGRPTEPVEISCGPSFVVCHCSGAFDCAWLSWYCAALGGVGGFDGECYLPSSVPGTNDALLKAKKLMINKQLKPRNR